MTISHAKDNGEDMKAIYEGKVMSIAGNLIYAEGLTVSIEGYEEADKGESWVTYVHYFGDGGVTAIELEG